MGGFDREPGRAWDEYDWERFLQQQDHKTEKYMELLEKYLDDPQRDEIIAREMGWSQLLDAKDWSAEVETLLNEDWRSNDEDAAADDEQKSSLVETFEDHNLYRAAFALTVWIDQLFDLDASLQNEPAAVKLATHSALASAKLAAALSDEDVAGLESHHRIYGRGGSALDREAHYRGATLRASAAALPGSRWHHQPDGRISRRVATPLRQPLTGC
ncbi:MAG: hypothetical protein DMF17_02830 [Verrucomicrobia bacterium]|nr:MAG: hypothetical protein DMF17_02830 [Verrucomicrobiota bacterium]